MGRRSGVFLGLGLLLVSTLEARAGRKIVIDEDASGPGGTNLQTVLVLIQSPGVDVLGITIASGDQWRDEEIAHTLRLLEIIGRTDIPVFGGAAFPIVRTRKEAQQWQERYGKTAYSGAWDDRWWHEPSIVPNLPEGEPTKKAAEEDAAHFLVRMVRKYPHEVTIYEGAPMTNVALAISLDADFAALSQGLVFMGGSLNPQTSDPEFANNPRHEFNFWFDPEAAEIVLRAPWKKIVCTPTDISIKTRLTAEMVKRIEAGGTLLAQYVARYFQPGGGNDYMWDELAAAAWVDPSIITKRETRSMSVDTSRGAGYGNTITWTEEEKPRLAGPPVEIQLDLDVAKFNEMFVRLMSAPVAPIGLAAGYPAHWWTPVPEDQKAGWEVLPQGAKPGEVILSKRNELGILSNFAATPFTFHGVRYASVEGFWQMMLYPEGAGDPRAKATGIVWAHTRDEVARMTGFEAKDAGTAAEANMQRLGIDWVTFEGRRIAYRSKKKGAHYELIAAAMRAKMEQNPKVREILLATGDLTLLPDHIEEADAPAEWRYFEMWMEMRGGKR